MVVVYSDWTIIYQETEDGNSYGNHQYQNKKKLQANIINSYSAINIRNLHDLLSIPDNGVSVKCSSWVEPQMELLFFVAFALRVNIGMNCVRLARNIA